jgi:filamentous hemagglutinin family protein
MRRKAACLVVSAITLIGGILHAGVSQAQIIHDTSLGGPRTDLGTGPNLRIDPGLGKQRGTNLFYSFEQFNVQANQTATFGAPPSGASVSNIVSRVTGGSSSQISGTIAFDPQIHGANFFLLNPNGVIVGPGATFDVGGSVHLTTADYLRFADGTQVFARPVAGEVLSVSAPAAFGFLGTSGAVPRVEVGGVTLQVAQHQTLSLIGGEVAITGAKLAAPGGRVQIASLLSGEVTLDGSVASSSRLGPITITGNSLIGTTGFDENGIGLGGGTVIIRGGQLLVDNSTLVANTSTDVAGPRLIDIQVIGDVVLTNGARISSATFVADRGGDVRISADQLRLENQSLVETNAVAEGDGGDVRATVGGLTIVGVSSIGTTAFATGHGGNITVKADAINISDSSQIFSNALADGNGGKVSLAPRSSMLDLVLDNAGAISSATLFGNGSGGDIQVDATNVSLRGGATINSTTSTPGPGGAIAVRANSVTISGGDSANPDGSGIFSGSVGAADTGRPGKISVDAVNFTLTQGGVIQSGGLFVPVAGDIEITAKNSLVISSGGSISTQAFAQPGGQVSLGSPTATAIIDGGFVNTSTFGDGAAGNVVIDVATLRMRNGAQVSSSSAGQSPAPGGSVTVKADSVAIVGRGASINPVTNDASTGLFSTTASPDPQGAAGKVVVTARALTIADGGKISVESTGVASAGDISLTVGNLTLAGGAGLFSNATSDGAGGNINVRAGQVRLSSGATISAKSAGTGFAGSITIRAGTLDSHGSFVTTEATQADGGDIDIQVGSLLHLSASEILTSVQSGGGKGGNITIDPQFVVLNNSQIRADAFGGPGGNIGIVTGAFLSSGSTVSASSALSAPGTIDVQAQTNDVSGSVARLPESVLQAAALLPASCEVRMAGGSASSLIVAGRDGVPVDPGGPLPTAGLLGQAWLLAAQKGPPARSASAANVARMTEAMSARLAGLLPCTQ